MMDAVRRSVMGLLISSVVVFGVACGVETDAPAEEVATEARGLDSSSSCSVSVSCSTGESVSCTGTTCSYTSNSVTCDGVTKTCSGEEPSPECVQCRTTCQTNFDTCTRGCTTSTCFNACFNIYRNCLTACPCG